MSSAVVPRSNFTALLGRALARRSALLSRDVPLRLFDGAGDGLAGLYLDRFGPVILAHWLEQPGSDESALRTMLAESAAAALAEARCTSLYLRVHRRDPRRSASGDADLICGAPAGELWVTEHDIRYLVRPVTQVNAGLFIDTRELRKRLQDESAGKRVLNLFCFTGALGLAAASGGASEVVQVDVSKAVLTWARQNLDGNLRCSKSNMRFIPEDALRFLDREVRRIKRGESGGYDIIIVDPPSFGTTEGGRFELRRQLDDLLERAVAAVKSEGILIATCNTREISADAIERSVQKRAAGLGRRPESVERLSPPQADFTACPSESLAMRGVWARMGE